MSSHPAFLIVRAKIAEAKKAVSHMEANDSQQKSLASTNPEFYSRAVHAESMATNVQGIYTNFEGILKALANAIDGYVPTGESSHRDLLLQVSMKAEYRDAIIQQETLKGLSQLLRFRHAMRNNYAGDLRADDVFDNVSLAGVMSPKFFDDLEAFIQSYERDDKQVPEESSRPGNS
jgi:hypothetical protein